MIKQKFSIDGYWDVIVYYSVYLGEDVAGFTKTDFSKKTSVIAIGVASTTKSYINTIAHEAKHLQSHICRYYKVPEDGEQASYLIGYIVGKMFEVFKNLI